MTAMPFAPRAERTDLPPPGIFKSYDIRGIVDVELTPEHVRAIGQAIGSEARDRGRFTIVIARDGRLSGPGLLQALSAGLNASGCDVINIGLVPTPLLYFATLVFGTGSGVMLTGSHNPPQYNGLKILLDDETLSGAQIKALYERLVENRLHTGAGTSRAADVRQTYLDRVISDVHLERPLKIILDCGNGATGELAPTLFRALGCAVTTLFADIDGRFPNHHPDPSQPENLKDLQARVTADGADVGLAFDGDGDRLAVIAPNGDIIWPDRQLILFARDVLSRHPGGQILYDVKCSQVVDTAIRKAGGRPLMWKTGHSFIKARIRQGDVLLAGEMSGHIFFKERWTGFDDGLYAGARLLELLAKDPASPAAVFAALPNTVNTPEIQLPVTENPHALVDLLIQAARFADAKVTTIDGLRVDFPDGFGLIRASNTTPILVLRFEGTTRAALERIEARFRELVKAVRPALAGW
ncbi:phosphomannomutase/phosphoglucomutase [Acidiferrobacter sp.]|jgi:phosphomannomutase/phosphoglucomutase|uniref:phosphomannomutase/phosphoglucomutase n=2 Tax=Acidiferrobacter sp. TaxID=1872107 RepID=UPI002609B543|nr:phosphomannomutase/phosphoglucomutase [Acidiferrobacter sp.]